MNLYVKGVTGFTLFSRRCPCGELTVHGFWHQLDKTIDAERRRAVVRMPCSGCGAVHEKRFRLTTGKGRPRLVDWLKVFWWAMPWVPSRWFRPATMMLLFLETRFPL